MSWKSLIRGMMASTVLRMHGVITGSGGVRSAASESLDINCLQRIRKNSTAMLTVLKIYVGRRKDPQNRSLDLMVVKT